MNPSIRSLQLKSHKEEYAIRIPGPVRKLTVLLRGDTDHAFRIGFRRDSTFGEDYLTVDAGSSWWEDNIPTSPCGMAEYPLRLWIRCPDCDNLVAEILWWA